tara:strand:+ start:733 stop:1356 length:624 start_codon:yes stop_codon:yes gene_type:complete
MSDGDALKIIQDRCGCSPDGHFGRNTAKGIVGFYELSPERGAHLLGQLHVESLGLRRTKEYMNYSLARLMETWPTRFPTEESAAPYVNNPKALAAKVYMRKELGNDTEEKAQMFTGRSFIQITGYANYKEFASDMSLPDVMTDPSLLESEYAMEGALWYFRKRKLWDLADQGVSDDIIKSITLKINGGTHGLEDRNKWTKKIYQWLI